MEDKAALNHTRNPVVAGVCPVLETPFIDDGSVDYTGFVKVIDSVVRAGAKSVMFPGFASEFHKLTDEERGKLIKILLDHTASIEGFTSVISVPDHATRIAVRRARQAVEWGAGAINVLPPHFLGPSRAAVHRHLMAVLEAVSPVPVILQYAPAQTGTALDATAISFLAADAENLVQVKVESTPPGALISALANSEPSLTSLVGYAGVQLPDALARGAVGVQPGSSFVELYIEVWELWNKGLIQEARDFHRRMLPYLSYWMQSIELIVAAEKEISARRGIIGSRVCREPAHTLDAAEQAMIDEFLIEFKRYLLPGR